MTLTLNDRLKRSGDYPFQKVLEETVIVEPQARLLHALNEIGSLLWAQLARPQTVRVLIERVTAEYEIDDDTARADVMAFLQEMLKRRLIEYNTY